jgi:hypothetical protein
MYGFAFAVLAVVYRLVVGGVFVKLMLLYVVGVVPSRDVLKLLPWLVNPTTVLLLHLGWVLQSINPLSEDPI